MHPAKLVPLLLLISCSRLFQPESINSLDATLASRPKIEELFQAKAAALRTTFEATLNWEYADSLYQMYKCTNLDSANVWLSAMDKSATNDFQKTVTAIDRAYVQYSARNYDDAQNLLASIDPDNLEPLARKEYYHAMSSLCSAIFNEEGLTEAKRKEYTDLRLLCFNKILELDVLTEGERQYYIGRLAQYRGEYEVALGYLKASVKCGNTSDMLIHTYYAIANCYKALGDHLQWKNYLAKTAVIDQQMNYRQYKSLYDLSLCLYGEGDYKRAERYINITLSDAVASRYGTRIVTASEARMFISAASAERNTRVLVLLILLVIIAIAATLIVYNYSRKLEDVNAQLTESAARLREADKIKEKYLFRYMSLSASYIKDIDDYRHELINILRHEGPEELKAKLRHPEFTYMKYDSFYGLFDDIFLSIYPSFIAEVNKLLQPEYAFDESLKTLPTELRILAVIRLGMTESGKIAAFLNVSSNTVYTYRVKMKNWSRLPREEFEKAVASLSMD